MLSRSLPSSVLLCECPQKAIQPPNVIVGNWDLLAYKSCYDPFPIEFGHLPGLNSLEAHARADTAEDLYGAARYRRPRARPSPIILNPAVG